MIVIKNKVLRRYSDEDGVTLVMRRRKIQERKWWFDKILSSKIITIWTTANPMLVVRSDYSPLQWLCVSKGFKYFRQDRGIMNDNGVLKDKGMLKLAAKYLRSKI